ncbi:MAG: ankyrin repeat domain-containing protein [Puniceicoccales bacterium]|jgi:ankyrin repeat protein|nr:ankyrin repeat domain-containing protein [Puniceicoccales bacterium]
MKKYKVSSLLWGTFLMPVVSYGTAGYGPAGVRLDGVAANDEKLFFAARTGDLAMAAYLLDRGANVNAVHDKGTNCGRYSTPLTWAIRGKNTEMVRLLLARGANVNAWMDDMEVPLIAAEDHRARDIMQLLLDRPGIDVNAKQDRVIWYDEDDYERCMANGGVVFEVVSKSALDIAREEGCTSDVQLLRAHGAR